MVYYNFLALLSLYLFGLRADWKLFTLLFCQVCIINGVNNFQSAGAWSSAMADWKLFTLLFCQVCIINGAHEADSQKEKERVDMKLNVPNFLGLIPNFNDLLKDFNSANPQELSDLEPKKQDPKRPLTPYFQRVRENYKIMREAVESALNRSMSDPNLLSMGLKSSSSRTKLNIESPLGQFSVKTRFQARGEEHEKHEASTEVPFEEYVTDLIQSESEASQESETDEFSKRALGENVDPFGISSDPQESDFTNQRSQFEMFEDMYSEQVPVTTTGYAEDVFFNSDESAGHEMNPEFNQYVTEPTADYWDATERNDFLASQESAYAPQDAQQVEYQAYGSEYLVNPHPEAQPVDLNAYAGSEYFVDAHQRPVDTSVYSGQYFETPQASQQVYPSYIENAYYDIQEPAQPIGYPAFSEGGYLGGVQQVNYPQYTGNEYFGVPQSAPVAAPVFTGSRYLSHAPQNVAPVYSESDYLMDVLTSPIHRTTNRHSTRFSHRVSEEESSLEDQYLEDAQEDSFDEYIDDIEAAAGKLTPNAKMQLRKAFGDFKRALDEIDLGRDFDLSKFLGGEPQEAGRRIIDQRDLEIAFLNIDAETNVRKDPSKQAVLAFTLTGIPLKLYIPQDIENSAEYLNEVLSDAGVTLNIPVKSSEEHQPVGQHVLYVGAGNKGNAVSTALILEVPDVKDIKRYTKRFHTTKHVSSLAVESDAQALKDALHKTLAEPETKFSDALEESFKSNPNQVLEDISTFLTQAPEVLEPSDEESDVIAEAEH